MTTTRLLANLFRALSNNDLRVAVEIANEISEHELAAGHTNVAKTLSGALHSNKRKSAREPENVSFSDIERNNASSLGLLEIKNNVAIGNIALEKKTQNLVFDILHEWSQKTLLTKHGLSPRNKLIFYGPPGCGKTLTANAIANRLGLPTYLLRFDAVIGAYLGQTATNLRGIFNFIESYPCVLLLDEIDALGKKRGDSREVGELDRIVIALFQELEHTQPKGLVVATPAMLGKFAKSLTDRLDFQASKAVIDHAKKAENYAMCEKLVFDKFRQSVLAKCTKNR